MAEVELMIASMGERTIGGGDKICYSSASLHCRYIFHRW